MHKKGHCCEILQEIYIRERKAVHEKYKDKHLAQLRALQNYEERVRQEEEKRNARERELERLQREEEELLNRLKVAQELQRSAYAELEVALEIWGNPKVVDMDRCQR